MSTKGCVAIGSQRIWSGVFNYQDSYPTYLGRKVVTDLLDIMMGNNPKIKSLESFSNLLLKYNDWKSFKEDKLPGYLDLHTNKNCDPIFIEWVYILNPKIKTIFILNHSPTAQKDRNGINIYQWRVAAKIDLKKIMKIIYVKSHKEIFNYVEEIMHQIERLSADRNLPFETLYYPTAGERRSTG